MSLLTEKIKELLSVEEQDGSTTNPSKKNRAILVSICSQKGGVGKTTTTVNLGCALAQFHHKKVLVVDLDPQGHVEKSLGALIPDGVEYTQLSTLLLKKRGNILDGVVPTELENFHLTPGDKALYETEGLLSTKIGKEFILGDILKPALSNFEIILFDCPPNLGNLTLNALVCSDFCLVPCEMSVLAFEGVNDLVETLDTVNARLNKRLRMLGVLFTRVDNRNKTMNEVVENNIRSYFQGKVFKSRIHINTALNKAQLEGLPVFHNHPSSTGSHDYLALADEFLKKIRNRRPGTPNVSDVEQKVG